MRQCEADSIVLKAVLVHPHPGLQVCRRQGTGNRLAATNNLRQFWSHFPARKRQVEYPLGDCILERNGSCSQSVVTHDLWLSAGDDERPAGTAGLSAQSAAHAPQSGGPSRSSFSPSMFTSSMSPEGATRNSP